MTDSGLQDDGSNPTWDSWVWVESSVGATIYAVDSSYTGDDGCTQMSNLGGYSHYYFKVLIDNSPNNGTYKISGFTKKKPPAAASNTAGAQLQSTTGSVASAESGSFSVDSVTSGGDLVVSGMTMAFSDGTTVTSQSFDACYCEDIPEEGGKKGGKKP